MINKENQYDLINIGSDMSAIYCDGKSTVGKMYAFLGTKKRKIIVNDKIVVFSYKPEFKKWIEKIRLKYDIPKDGFLNYEEFYKKWIKEGLKKQNSNLIAIDFLRDWEKFKKTLKINGTWKRAVWWYVFFNEINTADNMLYLGFRILSKTEDGVVIEIHPNTTLEDIKKSWSLIMMVKRKSGDAKLERIRSELPKYLYLYDLVYGKQKVKYKEAIEIMKSRGFKFKGTVTYTMIADMLREIKNVIKNSKLD